MEESKRSMTEKTLKRYDRIAPFYDYIDKLNPGHELASKLMIGWGGVESLACHPCTMTHATIPEEKRQALGITPQLVRLSVGLEDPADLIKDLQGALEA